MPADKLQQSLQALTDLYAARRFSQMQRWEAQTWLEIKGLRARNAGKQALWGRLLRRKCYMKTRVWSPGRKRSPAKGIWQNSDVRKSDQKVTERAPKTKKVIRTPFANLLLRHPDLENVKTCKKV